MEDYLRITTQSKIQLTLKETDKVKEVEMISGDAKEDNNINYNKEGANIDDLNQTIVENEDRTVTEEAISIDNKEEIRTNVEGVSNKNNKSIAAKIVDNIQQPSTNSKDNDNTVVDKVIESSANIKEVIAISKEALGTEVNEEVDIIDDERVTKIDVEEHLRITTKSKIHITLKETAKVKELEIISVDTT